MPNIYPNLAPVHAQPFSESNDARTVVVIGGSYRTIPSSYSVTINAHGATNSATVTLPISSNPDFSRLLAKGAAAGKTPAFSAFAGLSTSSLSGLSVQSQASQAATTIAIYAGFNASAAGSTNIAPLSLRFTGLVDEYTAAFHGDLVTFHCRAATAVLFDTKVTHISQNQTTVAFISEQCAKYGLKFVPDPDPSRPLGTIQQVLAYDQIGGSGFAAAIAGMRIWDLMLRCALFDDVDLWETLGTVYYQSPLKVTRVGVPLRWLGNISSFTASHSLQQNKNIQVQVHGHMPHMRTSSTSRVTTDAFGSISKASRVASTTSDSIMGTAQTETTSATGTTIGTSSGGSFTGTSTSGAKESSVQKYEFWVAQSPARCDLLAAAYARQISMHEYAVSLDVPMTKALLKSFSITSKLEISGAPYAYFNNEFWIRDYEERFSLEEGFMLSGIQAVNHSLAAEAAA